MILNAYSVLAAFVAVAELVLGLVAVVLGLRAARGSAANGATQGDDARTPLLHLTASRLVLLGAASLPLVYLMLRSYVAEWPGIMCVQGVTRVGSVSIGIAAWLPTLLATLLATKCALLIVSGGWMALHAVDRGTHAAPLVRRVAAWIAIAGAVAVVDAGTQITYLAIPKREVRIAVGCCTMATAGPVDTARPEDADEAATARRRAAWTAAFFGLGTATALLAAATMRRGLRDVDRAWWAPVAAGGAISTAVAGAGFLPTSLGPARLRQPLHECGWCLVERAPEIWLGVAALVGASACVVWAAILSRAAPGDEVRGPRAVVLRRLLGAACLGFSFALVMAAVERWLA